MKLHELYATEDNLIGVKDKMVHIGDLVTPKLKRYIDSLKRMGDPVDIVTMDVPLLTRIMELSREDIKTDADLHEILTRLIKLSKMKKSALSMDEYAAIEAVLGKDKVEETLKKVHGKWALVSKSDPNKVLQYYRGPAGHKPSKEWEQKVERRIRAFEEILPDVKTYSPEEIAKKHGVSTKEILRQLKMGQKVELEHTKDPELAKEIALDHLLELPNYYTKLAGMENE